MYHTIKIYEELKKKKPKVWMADLNTKEAVWLPQEHQLFKSTKSCYLLSSNFHKR